MKKQKKEWTLIAKTDDNKYKLYEVVSKNGKCEYITTQTRDFDGYKLEIIIERN